MKPFGLSLSVCSEIFISSQSKNLRTIWPRERREAVLSVEKSYNKDITLLLLLLLFLFCDV